MSYSLSKNNLYKCTVGKQREYESLISGIVYTDIHGVTRVFNDLSEARWGSQRRLDVLFVFAEHLAYPGQQSAGMSRRLVNKSFHHHGKRDRH